MTKPDLAKLRLEDYPARTYDKVRFADTDRTGHVNNAAFATFSETGRAEFLFHPENPVYSPGNSFSLASLNMNLLAEISFPGTVDIGTGITKVGNSSIHLVQGIYQNGLLCATVETVVVHITGHPARSCPLREESREILKKYTLTAFSE